MMRFLVFQHVACEHPGLLKDLMRAEKLAWDTIDLGAGARIPSLDDYAALLVFGGPMSVNDEGEFPWLSEEIQAIRDAVSRGLSYLGFCLGAQLLARALGSPVRKGPAPEVGCMPVKLTSDGKTDCLFDGLPEEFTVFQWHGETFATPTGGVRLAESRLYPEQAFRYGARAFGLQFHVEVTADMIDEWAEIPEYRRDLERTLGADGVSRLRADHARYRASLESTCRTIFANFLRVMVLAQSPPPRGVGPEGGVPRGPEPYFG